MSDEQKTEQTAATVGQKIASTELSIPLNIPLTERQVTSTSPPPEQGNTDETAAQPGKGTSSQTEPNPASDSPPPSGQETSPPAPSGEAAVPEENESSPSSEKQPSQHEESDDNQEQPDSQPDGASSSMPADQSGQSPAKTTAKDQLSEAIQSIEPITVKATPADAKAAMNPAIKLFVGIGAAISLIGIICAIVINALTGISIVALGVLIVVGGVLSPKPGH